MFFSHKTQCLRPTTPTHFVSNMGMKDYSVTKEALPVNRKRMCFAHPAEDFCSMEMKFPIRRKDYHIRENTERIQTIYENGEAPWTHTIC